MTKPVLLPALVRARVAWGLILPDWVVVLAQECDRTSQGAAAARLGYSGTAISQILNAKYNAELTAVERAVRAVFMAVSVECPVFGRMPSSQCLENQKSERTGRNAHVLAACESCSSSLPKRG